MCLTLTPSPLPRLRNGSEEDARERCYGFPPLTASGAAASGAATGLERLASSGVAFHMQEFTGAVAAIDEARNERASVDLFGSLWTEAIERAVVEVTDAVRPLVAPQYRRFVAREQLIALQPNSHNSAVGAPRTQQMLCLLGNTCS